MRHKRLASFNRLAMRVVAPVLVLAAFSAPVPYPRSRAIVQSAPVSTHTVSFAYWSQQSGFSASVILNNATIRPLTVHPTLYSLDGRAVKVSPVVLQPLAHAVASLPDWLAQAGADAAFTQGSLSLTYEAVEATFLGSQVTLTDQAASLSFDVPSNNAWNHALSELQGL